MGIFDKKKKDDVFDEATPVPEAPVRPPTLAAPPVVVAPPVTHAPPAAPAAAAVRYSIDDAITLLRKLPQGNVELVVQVVRTTLESVKIHVHDIVKAADDRLKSIDVKITTEKQRISELQADITTRQTEIGQLQKQFDETKMVMEKLILAEEIEKRERQHPASPAHPPERPPERHNRPTANPAMIPSSAPVTSATANTAAGSVVELKK